MRTLWETIGASYSQESPVRLTTSFKLLKSMLLNDQLSHNQRENTCRIVNIIDKYHKQNDLNMEMHL
jgi:hypothetical protein